MADGSISMQAPYRDVIQARLSPVDLIHPIVAGTPTPAALPGQQLPDWMQRAKEGADLARTAALLPAERQQAVAKAMMDKMASEQAKEMQDQFNKEVKAIQLKYPGDPVRQGQEIMMARLRQGLYWSSGGQSNPQMLLEKAPGAVENPSHPEQTQQPPQQPPQKTQQPPQKTQQPPQQPGILDRNRRAPDPNEVMLDQNQPGIINPAPLRVAQVSNLPIMNAPITNASISDQYPPLIGGIQPAPLVA